MSYRTTTLPSHIRPSSGLATSNQSSSSTQSSALQARINEKKAELESLKQLRDLSAGLAGQMQQLEEKLATLSNGTEAVAEVLSNWNGVLRAVYMASAKMPKLKDEGAEGEEQEAKPELPQTLVRIPVHQAEAAQREAEAAAEAAGE
ncbi:DASH complex subunit dad2 [Saxophila tyrrhenica]|uniref:DASH complex subunit DAD2 n=1 Tax=Saxophila tyrrhenica TaxID=1690608 RepID=A0AAV9PG23_9PEZI|nr:DASH complex subunit dad2 [Saxophila tyrrhenica]